MIAPTQIRKPENWQDFEKLCKKLWGEIWNCSNSIKRNGRGGQTQCGVDVSGLPLNENGYYGIQCKGKDDYLKAKLTEKEIDTEIVKAQNFSPKLKCLIFATTADKDVSIEQYIRKRNIEHINNGLFSIDVFSWADIVDLLEEHRNTYNWYINNCQYKDASDVEVLINGESEFEIHPQYIRTTKIFKKRPEIDPYINPFMAQFKGLGEMSKLYGFDNSKLSLINSNILLPWNQKRKIDCRWCTIPITLKNIGSTVIEDYKMEFVFEKDKIEEIDDKYRSFNPGPLFDQSTVAAENRDRQKRRETFESSEYYNLVEFRPINATLVQDDRRPIKIGVKPKDNVTEIQINWILKSRDYKKEGKLLLKVLPLFEEKKEYIDVDEIKETEIVIVPKIIEE